MYTEVNNRIVVPVNYTSSGIPSPLRGIITNYMMNLISNYATYDLDPSSLILETAVDITDHHH